MPAWFVYVYPLLAIFAIIASELRIWSAVWRWFNAPATQLNVVLLTDPGPDPDDVKVLVMAAMFHRAGKASIKAVIANGGGEAENRATLAKAVLNAVNAKDIPVGVGSEGLDKKPGPYEYSLAGFEEVDRSELHDGHELLVQTLREASPRSITIQIQSAFSSCPGALESGAPSA